MGGSRTSVQEEDIVKKIMAGIVSILFTLGPASGGENLAPDIFRFERLENYNVGHGLGLMRVVDMDGDGIKDVLLVDNSRSRIVVLGSKRIEKKKAESFDSNPNRLDFENRMERRTIIVNDEIRDMQVADMNGDGRADLLLLTNTNKIVYRVQRPDGTFENGESIGVPDANLRGGAMKLEDLNGDKVPEIVMLTADGFYVLSFSDGKFEKVRNVIPEPFGSNINYCDIWDVDGDGIRDVALGYAGDEQMLATALLDKDFSVRVTRFTSMGKLRTMKRFVDGGEETFAAVGADGKSVILKKFSAKDAGGRSARLAFAGIGVEREKNKDLPAPVWFDVNGDGIDDLTVVNPQNAEVIVKYGRPDGSFSLPANFPTLLDVTTLTWLRGGDGCVALVLSPREKILGCSGFEQSGRLGYPRQINVPGTPLALGDDLGGTGRIPLVTSEDKTYKQAHLVLLAYADGGAVVEKSVAIGELPAEPTGVVTFDLDQDGKNDALVFMRFKPPLVFLGTDDGFERARHELDPENRFFANVTAANFFPFDIDSDGKPELVLLTPRFLRAYRYDGAAGLKAVDQINAPTGSAWSVAYSRGQIVYVLDAVRGSIEKLVRDDRGVFARAEEFEVIKGHRTRIFVAEDGGLKVGLMDDRSYLVGRAGAVDVADTTIYELDEDDKGVLYGIDVADLNGDGVGDIVLLESFENHLLIFSRSDGEWKKRADFQIFEKKDAQGEMMREYQGSRRGRGMNFVLEDVNGDGLTDIVIHVHDRVLVYPAAKKN